MDAVVFDMDGVIVESETHWKRVEADILGTLLPNCDSSLQERTLGLSMPDIYRLLTAEYAIDISQKDLESRYWQHAERIYYEEVSLVPGSRELVVSLAQESVPLAMASSSPLAWMKMVVERFQLGEYFKILVSSDELGGKGKPSPEIYQRALKYLNKDAEGCVAIEDSSKGISSARSAGLACVGLRNGSNSNQDMSQANYVAEGFAALSPEVLRTIVRNARLG